MTGDIVNIGDGRKPAPDAVPRIQAAKASLPEHDPLHDVLDAMASTVQSITSGRVLTPEAERQLCTRLGEQAGNAVEAATWRAHRRMDWRLAGMIGAAVAVALAAGVGVGYWRGWVGAYAEADARIIDTGAVLGTLPAGDASAWAKLVRDNAPIRDLLSHAQPIPSETRGKAVALAVWIDPPKPPTPGAH